MAQLADSQNDENRVESRFNGVAPTFEQPEPNRKLTLNVGGFANLYEGTSIKIKCPVRNFNRNKIVWTKNGEKVHNSGD